MASRLFIVVSLTALVADASLQHSAKHAYRFAARDNGATFDPPTTVLLLPEPVPFPVNATPTAVSAAMAQVASVLNNTLNGVVFPGLSYSISYLGTQVASGGLGLANKSSAAIPTPDTIFRVGSVTKVLTTLVLFGLVRDGYIPSLDTPVSRYVPALAAVLNPYPGDGNFTFRHLASHMAGLMREAPAGQNDTDGVIATILSLPLSSPPGKRPLYSNLGFGLLGHVLAEYVVPELNTDLPGLVQRYVLGPLGMDSSGFNYTQNVLERMAVGYNADGSVAPLVSLGWAGPAGDAYSTANDLTKLAQAIMDCAAGRATPGALALNLSSVLARELLTPQFAAPNGTFIVGTPWEAWQLQNVTLYSKDGDVPGFSAFLSFVPELALSVVVTWNGNGAPTFQVGTALWEPLAAAFIDSLYPLQPSVSPGPAPAQYVGIYTGTYFTYNVTVNVSFQGDGSLFLLASVQAGPGVWLSGRLEAFEGDTFTIQAHDLVSQPEDIIVWQADFFNSYDGSPVSFVRLPSTGAVCGCVLHGYGGLLYTMPGAGPDCVAG